MRAALDHFDEVWCKLDAGTEAHFRFAAGTRVPYEQVLGNLLSTARERPIVLQSLFFAFEGCGPPQDEIDAYVGRLENLLAQGGRVAGVQVYTVARRPADSRVGPLRPEALEAIAGRMRVLGVPADAFV